MNNQKCPFCYCDSINMHDLGYFSIMQCGKCGHTFSSTIYQPLPSNFYEQDYFSSSGEKGYQNYQQEAMLLEKDFRDRLKNILSEASEKQLSKIALLDIGCANGIFLKTAKKFGLSQLYGIELSEFASKQSAKQGFSVFNINIEKENKSFENKFKGFFDIVTAFDLIEHCFEPQKALKNIYNLIKPGGIFAFSTPDISSISVKLMGKKWPHFKKEHLHYFSKNEMRKILTDFGFSDIKISPTKSTVSLTYLLEKVGFSGISKLLRQHYMFNKMIFSVRSGEMEVICKKTMKNQGKSEQSSFGKTKQGPHW